ncbi:MAG: hypothetical protein LBH06_04265 [Rikenellaceae bacterium]|jgi:hypothetical protein|nr:hypothetical protein [Rikenellaceae bacterium]
MMTIEKTGASWRAEDFTTIGQVNWQESYPDRPEVRFAAAHNGGELLLRFEVKEECVLGRVTEDNGPVWRDSCVEFFVAFDADGYYNFEFNCLGSLLLCFGEGRGEQRVKAPAEVLQAIGRKVSLNNPAAGLDSFQTNPTPFGLLEGGVEWNLEARIPVAAFFMHSIGTLDGVTARANFNKCGDDLPRPHFLSWQPISTPQPDFHRPEFFGEVRFM